MNAVVRTNALAPPLVLSPGPFTLGETGVVKDADGRCVCVLGYPEDELEAQDLANGHAILALPAMLKAAKRALATLKAQGESVRPGNVLGALEAAIALAEGRP